MNIKQSVSLSLMAGLFSLSALAYADVVVVVGAKSNVNSLTKTQISELYLGKVKDFPNGGGLALTTILGNGALKDEFFEKVLGKTDSQARSVWARLTFTGVGTAPKEVSDSAEVKKLVANNPNVIGFIDKAAVDAQVKVVYSP